LLFACFPDKTTGIIGPSEVFVAVNFKKALTRRFFTQELPFYRRINFPFEGKIHAYEKRTV
jgi:hypothetical protein